MVRKAAGPPAPVSLLTTTLPRPKALKCGQEPLLDGLPSMRGRSGRLAGPDRLLFVVLGVVDDLVLLPGHVAAARALVDDGRPEDLHDAALLALAAALQVRRLAVHPAAGDPLLRADLELLGRGLAFFAFLPLQLLLLAELLAFGAPDRVLDRGQVAGGACLLVGFLRPERGQGAHQDQGGRKDSHGKDSLYRTPSGTQIVHAGLL